MRATLHRFYHLSRLLYSLGFVVALVAVAWWAPWSQAQPLRRGDLNLDGAYSILDVLRLSDHLTGKAPLLAQDLPLADLDQNSRVDQAD